MSRTSPEKAKVSLRGIWNGMLGISVEILLTVFFILTGLAVCLFWRLF